MNILLVEDNPGDADLVQEALTEAGTRFNLYHVEKIKDARACLPEKKFDVILLDLGLPDGNGIDTVIQMHNLAPRIPIVVMTGLADEVVSTEAMKYGTQDYLVKGQVNSGMLARTLFYAVERKLAEERLQQTKERAEEATRLKDKFVSLVSHDLRAPLANIMGLLKILGRDKEHPLYEKQKDLLKQVIGNCECQLGMIDELLKTSRLQTGKIKLQYRFLDGHKVAALAVYCIKQLAIEKGIELVNNVPTGTRIYADRELFGEVIKNLVSNAVKFCNRGDVITLFVPHQRKTTLAVRDTGLGISRKILPVLFTHEKKTTTLGTAGEKGTGLGLPLCHDIMKTHGGGLFADSAEGEGSVFYAELPLVRPRILIVDDEEMIRSPLKKELAQVDADFMEAENGKEALNLLQETEFHLVITDVMMPVMDGFELLDHIRNDPKTKSVPVIVITGGDSIEICDKAIRKGANDFISKPWNIHSLIPRVRRFTV